MRTERLRRKSTPYILCGAVWPTSERDACSGAPGLAVTRMGKTAQLYTQSIDCHGSFDGPTSGIIGQIALGACMKNLFEKETTNEIVGRIDQLQPSTQRQWGKMEVAQM